MNDADWERLLKKSLANTVEPEEKLNQYIIHQFKERSQLKHKHMKSLSTVLVATVLLLVLSVSAYAASQYFSPKQVAEHLGDQLLADAFESKDAIHINQSKDSGDYHITLHGLVSGAGLSDFPHSSEAIFPDRTYAVVSIARLDGQPMPSTADDEYGKNPFFISPLIKGQEPWQVNIVTMNGAYSETVIDGVMYRIIECDQVEWFADRGVYMAISSGSSFFSKEAFKYDELTGEIKAREDYNGAALLFDLPLDASKANAEQAEAYLEQLLDPVSDKNSSTNEQSMDEGEKLDQWLQTLRAKIRNGESIGETIADSIKEVSYDETGNIHYTYEDWSYTKSLEQLFADGVVGFTDRSLPVSGWNNDVFKALLFHKDENGIITGRIVILDKANNPEF